MRFAVTFPSPALPDSGSKSWRQPLSRHAAPPVRFFRSKPDFMLNKKGSLTESDPFPSDYSVFMQDFRHFMQTLIFCGFPPISAVTLIRFGLNTLFVLTPICCPAPPFFFGCPFRGTLFPATVPFPQISHLLAISIHLIIVFDCK